MAMAISEVLSDTALEAEQPNSAWHRYLLEQRDTLAKLAWYLVADAVLVKCVMMRSGSAREHSFRAHLMP
jgi:hypothetical protein